MNLASTLVYAYGTSEGVSKAWDTRGRGRKQQPENISDDPNDTKNYHSEWHAVVDFDGTLVTHRHGDPGLGTLKPNSVELLRRLHDEGYHVHLVTARTDQDMPKVQKLLDDNGLDFVKAGNRKMPAAIYVDDRAHLWTGDEPVDGVMDKLRSTTAQMIREESGAA